MRVSAQLQLTNIYIYILPYHIVFSWYVSSSKRNLHIITKFCIGHTHCNLRAVRCGLCQYVKLESKSLTLYLLTWRIWWAPNNARKGQMGFNSAFERLIWISKTVIDLLIFQVCIFRQSLKLPSFASCSSKFGPPHVVCILWLVAFR